MRAAAVAAFHHAGLRIYTSADPVGVEVGGAVKNVLAIATGIADGMGLGLNARAALVTRGLAEMTRLGVALGARRPRPSWACRASATSSSPRPATCRATARSASSSRRGKALADILADLGHVAEGVRSAPMVLARAAASGVEMPIVAAVADVLGRQRSRPKTRSSS